MKKIFNTILLLIFASLCHAQFTTDTIHLYTPNGTLVIAELKTEMSQQDIILLTNQYVNEWPNAELMDSASRQYNCHSYAWNMVEGGPKCWLWMAPGEPHGEIWKYWEDGSYVETTEAYAEKIVWFQVYQREYYEIHSCVKSTTHSGKHESKWGRLPLFRHSPDYHPYTYEYYGDSLYGYFVDTKYYRRPCNMNIPDTIISISTVNIGDIPNISLGNIIILPGVTLTVSNIINFAPNSSIIVQPGGKLIVDGGTLTSACPDSLWGGIIVLGNKNMPQLPQYQGMVELKSGAVIEHAFCAISAAPESYGASAGGGIIYADSATFRNNLVAIAYRSYENINNKSSNKIDIIDNVGKFTYCTFTFNSNNRFSANGKTFRNHVTLWEVRGITFEACLFEDRTIGIAKLPAPWNYGINTIDAGFKVINHCRKGGEGNGVDCSCLSFYSDSSIFSNLVTGINSENTGTAYYIHIDQSKFQNLSAGVRINAQNDYRLTRCKFRNLKIGLVSDNSSGYMIRDNNFYSTLGVSGTGIAMDNSGGANNKIYKNDFNSLNKGISIQGINGPNLGGFSLLQGLQFIRNVFTNTIYDTYIDQGATVRSHQGAISSGADNEFSGTLTSSICSQSWQNAQSILYYHTSGAIRIPHAPTGNVTVNGNAAAGPIEVNPCIYPTKSGAHIDSIEQYKMMQEQYDQLLTKMEDNPEIMQELLALDDAMYELSNHAVIRILQDSILYVDALKEWHDIIRTPVAKYSLAELHFLTKDYEKADALLKEMPEMFQFEKAEIEEHENYLKFFNLKKTMTQEERNWTKLSDKEIETLEAIAQTTCGRSAGMARGVLCFFYDICKEYEECQQEESADSKSAAAEIEKASSGSEQYDLTVHPNPTDGRLKIESGKLKIEKAEMFDIFGVKVFETTETTFGIGHLPQGVYIIKIYLENKDIVTRKIVRK